MGNIDARNLADTIVSEMSSYNQQLTDAIKVEVRKTAKECAADIKKASPKLTGDYRKGWSTKVVYESDEDIRARVYNRTDYQLAHLLEHGHAKIGGGRVEGRPHIRPAEEAAIRKLQGRVKVRVRGS